MYVGVDLEELRRRGQSMKVARVLGVSEHEAIGMLTDAWGETQRKLIVTCTPEMFVAATAIRFDDPRKVFDAMVAAELISPLETTSAGLGPAVHWVINGNDKHVSKIQAYRSSASAGGKALAAKRHVDGVPTGKRQAKRPAHERHADGRADGHADRQGTGMLRACPSDAEPVPSISGSQYTDHDLDPSDPDLTAPQAQTFDPRSSLSSDCKSEIVLSASPSAAADALTVLDLPKPKGKQRSADQKRRSVANARLYCELYENAEKHPPSGLDASFYGMMAKFSDKHAENTETILRWVFASPDTFFRSKGWPLELIIAQAPKLWREANNPRAVVENIAAPRQQQQMALAASNDLAFEEYQRRKAERLAGSAP